MEVKKNENACQKKTKMGVKRKPKWWSIENQNGVQEKIKTVVKRKSYCGEEKMKMVFKISNFIILFMKNEAVIF